MSAWRRLLKDDLLHDEVPVIVLAEWDVLSSGTSFKKSLNMFEEPWLVPFSYLIQLPWFTAVNKIASHDHSLLS